MIVLRICALGDLIITGPLLEALDDPLLIAHGEQLALARAAGWVRDGVDADARSLHGLYASSSLHVELPGPLRERLARGQGAIAIGGPGPARDALCARLRALGAGEVRALDARPPEGVHAVDLLLGTSGRRTDPVCPRIELPAAGRERGRALLAHAGVDPGAGCVALHPGAGSAAKCWPVGRWIELAASLRVPLVAVEGPADAGPVAALRDALGVPALAGLELEDLAAALSQTSGLLGHDSGVSHLGAALGLPVLALFGPTDAASWAPRGPRARVLEAPGGALEDLAVEPVRDAVEALLQSASSR